MLRGTAEERIEKWSFSLCCFVAPRKAAGHGRGEFDALFCYCYSRCFQPLCLFNPLSLRALPLYGCATQGERIEKWSFSLCCFVAPRNAAGHGRGESLMLYFVAVTADVFNPSVFLTPSPYGHSPYMAVPHPAMLLGTAEEEF